MADLSNEAFEQLKADFKHSEALQARQRRARAKAKYEPQPGRAGRAVVEGARQAERAASVTARQAGRVRPGDAPIVPIMLLGVGGYLLWYSVHYFAQTKADGSTLWPSDPVKAVLTGRPMPATAHTPTAGQALAGETSAANAGQAAADAAAAAANVNPSGAPPASAAAQNVSTAGLTNQGIAKMMAITLGHADWTSGQQWTDWVSLWTRESGWSVDATNPSSGAYGIPQALGHATAGSAGVSHNEFGANYGLTTSQAKLANNGDPRWQIVWGIGYIQSVYGSPSKAWQHEESAGWY